MFHKLLAATSAVFVVSLLNPEQAWSSPQPQIHWGSEWGARAEGFQTLHRAVGRLPFSEALVLDLVAGIEAGTGSFSRPRFRDPEVSLWGSIAHTADRSAALIWRGDFRPGWGGRSSDLGRTLSTGGWLSFEWSAHQDRLLGSIGAGFRYHALSEMPDPNSRLSQWHSRIEKGSPPVPLDWEWLAGSSLRFRITPRFGLIAAGELRAGRWAIQNRPELLLASGEARLGLAIAASETLSFTPEIRFSPSWVEKEPFSYPLWISLTVLWRIF